MQFWFQFIIKARDKEKIEALKLENEKQKQEAKENEELLRQMKEQQGTLDRLYFILQRQKCQDHWRYAFSQVEPRNWPTKGCKGKRYN